MNPEELSSVKTHAPKEPDSRPACTSVAPFDHYGWRGFIFRPVVFSPRQSALGIVLFSKQIRQNPTLWAKARALARAGVFDHSASAFSPLSERTPSVELCLAHISGTLGSTMVPLLAHALMAVS